ncbi:MAG: Extracellular solute-binding protein family 1 [Thermomicrobiales bacterium]|nr:Extracellular solute-binding protein family 1 [Thermomicrobiales bacterium]MCD6057691.1 Extracellular solute-binding protein family 1 [Thermomicrobiales bacterium]MDF2759969.1 Extracellular solute-binding protein family 1 [Thermomicrobiales bacterium]
MPRTRSESRRRVTASCLAVVAAVVTLLGTLVPAAAQEPLSGELSFGFWGDPAEAGAYEAIVAAFEDENPGIDVQIEYVPNATDFYTRLATGYAAGLAPDVFLINYRRYGQFAARDALVPIGPLLEASEILDEEDYYPQPLEAFQFNGELMCLPQNLSSLVVYFNRDLFDAASVPYPEAGWTWDDFLAAAQALTIDIDGDGLTDQHGLGVENSLIRFTPFIWQAGGELVDDLDRPTTLTIDTPEAREGIQFFIDLSLVHKVVPTEAEVLAISDEDRFINGTTAMLLQSRRVVPTLRQIQSFTWDVAPLPQHEEAAGILHSDAYCMSATTENQAAAWKFIEFANGPEGQQIAARVGRTVPSLKAVAESPIFLGPRGGVPTGTDFDRFAPPASARVYLDTVPQIRRVPSISTWPEVEEAFQNTLGRAFYGEVPVEDAIAIAKARSEQAFQRAAQEESR